MRKTEETGRIEVRATVSLSGLGVGQRAFVDPTVPYIAQCIEREFLVPVGPGPVESEAEADATGENRAV